MKRRMNSYLLAGLIITGLMLIITLIGVFWTPYVPTAMKYGRFQPPSLAHVFGTDNFGRDIFSRVLKGTGTTLAIAFSTVSIGAVIGTLIGAVTGYFGGIVDDVLMRLNDALTAFPSFLLALLIVSLVGPGKKYSVVIALGLVFIPSFARVMRTEFASLRNRNFVTGARLMGAGSGRILLVHLLPNTLRVLLPWCTEHASASGLPAGYHTLSRLAERYDSCTSEDTVCTSSFLFQDAYGVYDPQSAISGDLRNP